MFSILPDEGKEGRLSLLTVSRVVANIRQIEPLATAIFVFVLKGHGLTLLNI